MTTHKQVFKRVSTPNSQLCADCGKVMPSMFTAYMVKSDYRKNVITLVCTSCSMIRMGYTQEYRESLLSN